MNPVVSPPRQTLEVSLTDDLSSVLPAPAHKTVLVVDLVESVRLMGEDEQGVVVRWQRFLRFAQEVIPSNAGRLVKSLGDGLLAEFEASRDALKAAHHLHRYFESDNASRPPQRHMLLRAGVHATHLYADALDIYGHGVNLAARIAGLAQPGDTVVTRRVRDTLIDGLDGFLHDMGESYLKHWPEAVRTWSVRTRPAGVPTGPSTERAARCRASVAVLPFQACHHSSRHAGIGSLIADGVIARLAANPSLCVISRLPSNLFNLNPAPTDRRPVRRWNARFVLSGSYATRGTKVILMAELTDTARGEVVWADRFGGESIDLIEVKSALLSNLSMACVPALLKMNASGPSRTAHITSVPARA
jgi:class 3 adenylate cyclase